MGSLNQKHLPLFWRLRSPISKCQQIWCLVPSVVLIHSQSFSCWVFIWWEEWKSSRVSFIRVIHDLITSQKSHIVILFYWDLRFQHMKFTGTQIFPTYLTLGLFQSLPGFVPRKNLIRLSMNECFWLDTSVLYVCWPWSQGQSLAVTVVVASGRKSGA